MDMSEIFNGVIYKVDLNKKKIERKIKKRKYSKKSIKVFKGYTNTKEYFLILFLYRQFKKGYINGVKTGYSSDKKMLNFVTFLLKFEENNFYIREYYLGVKLKKSYKLISERSFYSWDDRLSFDELTIKIIKD